MFLVRSVFWLTVLVLVLPPADGEHRALRESFLEAVQAKGVLTVAGPCERGRNACATGRDAITPHWRESETGAALYAVPTGPAQQGETGPDPAPDGLHGDRLHGGHLHGTLTAADLALAWAGPEPRGG